MIANYNGSLSTRTRSNNSAESATATSASSNSSSYRSRSSGINSAIPLAIFFLWPEWLITTLFKEDFAAGAPLLFPLAVAQLLVYLASMFAAAFASIKRFEFLYVYLVCLGLLAGYGIWLVWSTKKAHATER